MRIPRLHVPLLEPEDVVRHLGKQEKHWKEGRSAHALAKLWSDSNALPSRIETALRSNQDLKSAELIDAFLERKVDLESEGRPSQTDLLAVVGIDQRLAIVAVEGKAGEPFDKRVEKWLDGSEGKDARLKGLCKILGLSRDAVLRLRYQLLHRSASAVLEARRYRTNIAVLLIHSFSDDRKGFADFSAFLQALGVKNATAGVVSGPIALKDPRYCDISFYAGWVEDQAPKDGAYLDALRNYASRLSDDCKRIQEWCAAQQSPR